MKLAICGSMAFAKEMVETKLILEKLGHTAVISQFANDFLGVTEEKKRQLNRKNVFEKDAIKEFWQTIKESDAIFVLNYDRNGIKNYIGGNSFLEIGFAYVLQKKIFLLYEIPDISFYKAEIEGMRPIVLAGDLRKITYE